MLVEPNGAPCYPGGTHEAPTLLIACDNACDLHFAEVSHMPRAGAGKPWQRPAGKSLFRHNPAAQKESTQQLLCRGKKGSTMCTCVGWAAQPRCDKGFMKLQVKYYIGAVGWADK